MNLRLPHLLAPLALTAACGFALAAFADGPADNIAESVRPVPPPGIEVPAADREALEAGLDSLNKQVQMLQANPKNAPYLPDIQIYQKAVDWALRYHEFFSANEIPRAKALLATGITRAQQLAQGETPWMVQPGPTALGYVSEIDGSVQPYGLYIPASYAPTSAHKFRLDTWFHGRGEMLSELNFINDVQRGGGPFVRPNTFTVQLYGRYCCANKLAGEVDLFEAIRNIQRRYPIDMDRVVERGFSMGGAAAWHFGAHFASDWAAAAPGAGFSETPEFLKVFQQEKITPTWYEQKLWKMYDCQNYAENFANTSLVAYSGEIDNQKQAADVMDKALAGEGIKMVHIIGPKTGHAYHPQSIPILNNLIDTIADRGRNPLPRLVRLQTPILKYNRQAWVTADSLGREWEDARIEAQIIDEQNVRVTTKNVTGLTLSMPAGYCPLDETRPPTVTIDGTRVKAAPVLSDKSWTSHFVKDGRRWSLASTAQPSGELRKRHDLQGPIDDAFMGSFMMVRPTGTPIAPGVSKWVDSELQHAITEWRRQFRGDARVKNDADVTDADIAAHNLVLWGDPGSNKILARIADRLPIHWTREAVTVGAKSYPASTHAPVLIYPNPLNPNRYVVLNSGFTYREYDYLNNARQVPKLPDWAIVDTTTPPNSRYPGKIADAAFFGERWELIEQPQK